MALRRKLFTSKFNRQRDLAYCLPQKEALKCVRALRAASIIKIGSGVSTIFPRIRHLYGTKAALDAITVVLAKELGPRQDSRELD